MKKYLSKYGFAVLLAGGAFLFRQWFAEQFDSTLTYIFLYPPVLIAAVLAGVLPGLLATAIAVLLSATWIFPPIGRPWPLHTADLLGLSIFSAMAVLMCLMAGLYHRAQRRVQAFAREEATRDSEERFRTLADNIAQLAWMADEKGSRFWYNRRWFDFTGTCLEEMQGWGWQKVHHPDHDRRVVDKLSHCLRTGEVWEDTFPLRGKDGAYRWFLSRAIPIYNENGKVVRWFGTNTDVTDQRNAEEALRVAEERLRLAAEATGFGTFDFNPQTGDLIWSDQTKRHFGLSPGARIGYGIFLKGLHPEDRERVDRKVQDVLRFENGGTYSNEYRTIGIEDGLERWIQACGRVFFDEKCQPVRFIGATLDISEHKRNEEVLLHAKEVAETANRAKNEFLARMSHELRTPMTVIMGTVQHLIKSGPAAGQLSFLEMADISAHRLLGIINDLLDITRIENRKLKIAEKPFDLRETIGQTVEMFLPSAREKGLLFRWEMAPQVPEHVIGDPDRLGQILMNLIGNAIKFTEQGEIALTVTGTAERLEFSISDSGIGIPEEKLDRIFEPFNQVDSSLTRRHGGTGLGLAICRELVGLMGGEIRAESGFGQGSVFSFFLPVRPVASAASAAEPEVAMEEDRLSKRILLAEDDPMVRALVDLILCRRGWEVCAVENGRQAVERWQAGIYDLVLMDIQMPEMDGIEATRQIRRLESRQGTKTNIFALTAHAHAENRQECLAAGMDGVLTKPFRIEELDSLIQKLPDKLSSRGTVTSASRWSGHGDHDHPSFAQFFQPQRETIGKFSCPSYSGNFQWKNLSGTIPGLFHF